MSIKRINELKNSINIIHTVRFWKQKAKDTTIEKGLKRGRWVNSIK